MRSALHAGCTPHQYRFADTALSQDADAASKRHLCAPHVIEAGSIIPVHPNSRSVSRETDQGNRCGSPTGCVGVLLAEGRRRGRPQIERAARAQQPRCSEPSIVRTCTRMSEQVGHVGRWPRARSPSAPARGRPRARIQTRTAPGWSRCLRPPWDFCIGRVHSASAAMMASASEATPRRRGSTIPHAARSRMRRSCVSCRRNLPGRSRSRLSLLQRVPDELALRVAAALAGVVVACCCSVIAITYSSMIVLA